MKEDLDDDGNPLPDINPRLDTGFTPNLITDGFFEQFLGGVSSGDDLTKYIQCGTGTTSPANGDVSITPLGPRAVLFSRAWSTTSNEITCTSEFRFTQGAVVGTVSEVGIFQNSSGGSTMMRSLIKDVGGTPTTITLTSIDYLYITWRVKSTVNLSNTTGTMTIAGVSYNYTLKPCLWNEGVSTGAGIFCPLTTRSFNIGPSTGLIGLLAYGSQTLGNVTTLPSAAEGELNLSPIDPTLSAYVSSSKQRKLTWSIADSQGNVAGGIGSLAACAVSPNTTGGYQISFAAVSGGGKIPKDNTKTLTLSLTFTWSR